MNDHPTPSDPGLEDALRALTTPALSALDREAIRGAIRAAAGPSSVEGRPPAPTSAARAPWPSWRPFALAVVGGAVLTAAVLQAFRYQAPPHEPPALDRPSSAPTAVAHGPAVARPSPVLRSTPVALRVDAPPAVPTPSLHADGGPRDGIAQPRPPAAAPARSAAPAADAAVDAFVVADAVAVVTPPAEPPSVRRARAPRRPTATPGPVLPQPPTREPPTATSAPSGIAGAVRGGGIALHGAAVRALPTDGADGRFIVGASDAAGGYVLQLPPGTWRVVAEADGWKARWWRAADGFDAAEIVTVEAGIVRGGIDFDLDSDGP